MNIDKDKILEKWKQVLDPQNNIIGPIDSGSTTNHSIDWNTFSFPIVKKFQATTLAGGGWTKSIKQKLKESRLNKILKIQGKKPNVVLPNDEYVHGLVSVQPFSMPTGKIFYMDYKYGKSIKQQRKEKLIRILRKEKMEYIQKILKNN